MIDMTKKMDSVCLNHPNVPAVTRCSACAMPLCSDCAIFREGGAFCSEKCLKNAQSANVRVEDMLLRKSGVERKEKLRKWFTVVIVLLLLGGAYAYYRTNPEQINSWFSAGKKVVDQGASDVGMIIRSKVDRDATYKQDREAMVDQASAVVDHAAAAKK